MEIQQFKVGELEANCYFLISGDEVLMIDPGEEKEKIIEEFKKTGKKLKYIILTHYHSDHAKDAEKIKINLNSEILIHRDDGNYLNFNGVGADRLIKDGEDIEFGNDSLKVVHTPGHTEGSICLLGDNFLITGDTFFEEGYGRTDLPGGSPYKMKKSLERIGQLIKPGMTIYPGHGNFFQV